MVITSNGRGVNNYRYAKRQADAFSLLNKAKLNVTKTGKESTGFSHLVTGRIKWCPRSGLWRDIHSQKEGQGVGSMIKFLDKCKNA